jgi:hypothetical protein
MPARRKSLAPPPVDKEAKLKEKLNRRRSEGAAADVLEERKLLKVKAKAEKAKNKRREAGASSDEGSSESEENELEGGQVETTVGPAEAGPSEGDQGNESTASRSADDDAGNSDDEDSESDLDADEESALSAAVAAGLAAMFGQPSAGALSTFSAAAGPKARAKVGQPTPAFAASDPSPYLAKARDGTVAVRTASLGARPGHTKGCSVDVAMLADASDMYGRGATPRRPASASAAHPAALSGAHAVVTSGKGWFDLPATAMTEELKQDLRAVRMRGALDPKRFYKALDRPGKFVQLGTVVQGRDEFYTSRLVRKERRTNLVEELLADTKARAYTKRKYNAIQDKAQKKQKFGAAKKGKKIGFNKKKQSQGKS